MEWHSMNVREVLSKLGTSEDGLSEEEARRRLEKFGFNELKEMRRKSPVQMFLEQFKNMLIVILIIAALIAALLGETVDAFAILVIVVLNAVLGFVQEYRAEKALEALKQLAAPQARVLRGGKEVRIPAKELVPGDILLIESGDKPSADARLIHAVDIRVDESSLTGESTPVEKDTAPVKKDAQVAERKNMLFMGTAVTYGRGKAVVVETGMNTQIGKIAEIIQVTEEELTPLQKRLEKFGEQVGIGILIICGIVFISEIIESPDLMEMIYSMRIAEFLGSAHLIELFLISVSLAVAAIPEGLPAVITITLAMGLQRMVRRNSIVRKLHAVETLGSTGIICSDKTGTLTRSEMTVRKIYVDGEFVEVTGQGYEPKGEFRKEGNRINPMKEADLSLLLRIGALCNNSHLEDGRGWKVIGDPTEGALVVTVEKAGLSHEELKKKYPRVEEIPFDSERKRMTTIHKTPEKEIHAYMKGACEIVLERCSHFIENGKVKKLTPEVRKEILKRNSEMAEDALRVLAFAYRKLGTKNYSPERVEREMVFVGLMGMMDPPREEVYEAVRKCESAGMRVVMITGDHKITAVAVAKELGIMKKSSRVLTGEELDKLGEKGLERIVDEVAVYARVSPQHKIMIVKALKAKGHIVAMTGDGVNDAPALKMADIGIAMGMTGTDVSKEASDMILVDDNFASIVAAIEEGRGIFDNIKKFIKYLLSCNAGEVLTIFFAPFLNLPIPLLPPQILMMNLVTDGLPALALGVEPTNPKIMERPPRDPEEDILKPMIPNIVMIGFLTCVGTLLIFSQYYGGNPYNLDIARTAAFTTIVMFELFVAFACRSSTRTLVEAGVFSNRSLIIAVASSVVLQLAVIYLPPLQTVFNTVPLSLDDWGRILVISSTAFFAMEIVKLLKRRKR
ncbi:MAG: calcium-transporting P-type ATPase, PMR1-type [Candidatus Micrarchaeia archaeon]